MLVVLTWFVSVAASLPFERLHDDEVQYFLESRQILSTGPVVHGGLVFVPQLLGSIPSLLWDSVLSVRLVSAFAVLATAIAIYWLTKDDSGFVGAMLFLTSFYTLRFGMRFYLDSFGGVFAALTLVYIKGGSSRLAGAWAALGAFSRQLIVPTIPIFLYVAYRSGLSLRRFLIGLLVVSGLCGLWIYAAATAAAPAAITLAGVQAIPSLGLPSSPLSIAYGFAEFLSLSMLGWIGFVLAPRKRARIEFLPLLVSLGVLALTPGFAINGGATEYPYVTNVLLSVSAGGGLQRLYAMLRPSIRGLAVATVLVLLAQYSAQSYIATSLSPNHIIGVQDYGYNYDQELLTYLDQHYTGGAIYGSNRDGMLLPQVAQNWVWIPQNVSRALHDNPPWLVTYVSYVSVGYLPADASAVTIGPYLVIHTTKTPLSDFIYAVNPTGRFVP